MIYLDTNYLHGDSLIQLLPTEMLDWVNPKDFNLDNYSNYSTMACFLEGDLDYPDELHDLYNEHNLRNGKIAI